MIRLLLALASFFTFAHIALAADMPVKAPVKAPAAYDQWTGFYAGINGGYSWGRSKSDYTSTDPTAGISESNSDSVKINGILGGGQIGYNYRLAPSFLVGIETDFQWSGERGSNTVQICHAVQVDPDGICDFSSIYDNHKEKLEWFGTVRGRLGYLVAPNWLLYGTGGFAYGKLKRDDTYTYDSQFFCNAGTEPFCTPQSSSISKTKTGFAVGGGADVAVTDRWIARIEYLYLDLAGLGTSTFALTSGNPPLVNLTTTSHRFTDNIVRAAINYRFSP
jgi:outer membrane immunogenic protein